MPNTLVIADDEELIRWSLAEHMRTAGYAVQEAEDGEQALEAIATHGPAAVLLDVKMPKADGIEVLRRLREAGNQVPVIMITAYGAVETAIEATRLGATAYIQKPFDLREVEIVVEKALREYRLEQRVRYLEVSRRRGYGDFIGQASSLNAAFETLRRLETVDAPTVLVTGESGTGKDVVARAIHAKGPRRNQPFMEIDCAALPENLIESELFGHERGAFTDARQLKHGLFEVARGGIVFLDEIGEMTLATQAKLLRALENRTFKRVGGVTKLDMDVAIIAATNRDLRAEIADGNFREDLYFRLNVVPIHLPPLRQRQGDIPLLVEHFLHYFNKRFGRGIESVTGEAMARLEAYPWPGNVRELRNALERIAILHQGAELSEEALPPEIRFAGRSQTTPRGCPFTLPEEGVKLEEIEKGLLIQALERTEHNQSAAARLLGISRYALRYRMEKFDLS
ncbi:MAG: sigma-54-dependent Fis family transcriptional regulator [Deltaproteobacteria bacterium]|nr:MAG: sigma-54-dependent Fis family transcriptional regulator [Deltaproteobacteria bacterium]